MIRCTIAFLILLGMMPQMQVRAAFIIHFQDTTIAPNGVASIDVLLRSTDATALSGFNALFEISAETSGGVVKFQAAQSDSERVFVGPDYSYVFLNKLMDNGFSATRQVNERQISVGDFASEDVMLTANRDYLLARLEIQHESPVPTSGDFRLRLVNDPGFNIFTDSLGADLQIAAQSFQNLGTISVVPEPSALVLLGVAIGGGLLRRHRRVAAKA